MTPTNASASEPDPWPNGQPELQSVGALVIGGDHPGLAVARSLGRRGIPVYVVDDHLCISSYSRYVRRVVHARNLRDERSTIDAVMEIGRRFNLRNWVLFPTRDETVAAFARNRAELAAFFRVTTPEWDVVKWAWDKSNTYELAERLGVPCPKTFHVRTAEDLPSLYSKLPLAIKPAVKENFFYATGAKAWRANTPDDLQRMFAMALKQIPAQEILLQEIIPGDGSSQFSCCVFFRHGVAHSTLVATRVRQHPREFGRAATYVETIALPEIEELSQRLLQAINFYGLAELEFKQDPRDGKYKLLDINARVWGFHSLGSAAGVDFPYLLFADQLGYSSEHCRGLPGVGWIRWIADVPVVISELLHRHINLKSYITSLRRTAIESVFAREDPLPTLAEVVMLPYLIAKKYF
jgi:D-aspartate ligase